MQFVLLTDFFGNWLKRAQADVWRDLGRLDSALVYALQDFRREVQARRRRGDGAERFGVDRLVRLAVGGRVGAINVGRQRNVADAVGPAEQVVYRIEAKMALSKSPTAHALGREFM